MTDSTTPTIGPLHGSSGYACPDGRRTLPILVMAASLASAACSGYQANDRWTLFIGCVFYGDAESCFYIDDGPDFAPRHPHGLALVGSARSANGPTPLSVASLSELLHEEFHAFGAAHSLAANREGPAPTAEAFVTSRHPDWAARRDEIRAYLEGELGPDWIRAIAPPTATRRGIDPMEPL